MHNNLRLFTGFILLAATASQAKAEKQAVPHRSQATTKWSLAKKVSAFGALTAAVVIGGYRFSKKGAPPADELADLDNPGAEASQAAAALAAQSTSEKGTPPAEPAAAPAAQSTSEAPALAPVAPASPETLTKYTALKNYLVTFRALLGRQWTRFVNALPELPEDVKIC